MWRKKKERKGKRERRELGVKVSKKVNSSWTSSRSNFLFISPSARVTTKCKSLVTPSKNNTKISIQKYSLFASISPQKSIVVSLRLQLAFVLFRRFGVPRTLLCSCHGATLQPYHIFLVTVLCSSMKQIFLGVKQRHPGYCL